MMNSFPPVDEIFKVLEDMAAKVKMMQDHDHHQKSWTAEDLMRGYTFVYNHHQVLIYQHEREQVYDKYKSILMERINEKVLPSLLNRNGGEMVKELTRLWSEYKYFAKTMAVLLSGLNNYKSMDRRFPSHPEFSNQLFRDLVIVGDHSSLQKSLHDLIDEERERKEIDHVLNKKFLEFLVEMRLDQCSVNYYSKFEQMMLEETSKCYHQLSLEYRSQPDLFIDYIQKEEEKVKALYSEEDYPTRRKLLKYGPTVLFIGQPTKLSFLFTLNLCPLAAIILISISQEPKHQQILRETLMLKFISLEDGMMVVEEAIVKAKKIMEGYEMKFTGEEYQRFYEYLLCVYFMCTSRGSDEKTVRIYERYKSCLEESINMVLPSLISKTDVNLLRELVPIWSNYKAMARWLCRFFEYLDRYFIPQKKELPNLDKLSVKVFHELVFKNLYCELRATALSLIKQEREGLQIDQDLLKNVIFIFSEIDNCGELKYYANFEHLMLYESSSYYAQLSSEWLLSDSYADYMQKALWCLNQEEKRASQYLYPDTGVALLQVVKYRLLTEPGLKLAEKKQAEKSGFATEFQDVLSKCADLNLEGESSASTPEEWMSVVMTKATNTQSKFY
ncbi:hypothetical protein Pint_19812 [Pistacia integerrima]|uniref:Uncharacterized protein n=1 Tax=Pistacia integerrima TaxID=434235 RepID=A0ACC0XAT3_9ROSI|nr:hypothetical protein Pint_19812 [Pistacia integerrima]